MRDLKQDLEDITEHAPVAWSPEARLLMDSLDHPIQTDLIPAVDFNPAAGRLEVTLNEAMASGHRIPQTVEHPDQLAQPHYARGRFLVVTPEGQDLIRSLPGVPTHATGGILVAEAGDVPRVIELLRAYRLTEETAAARDICVHGRPLEQRTYLELEDPETLVVRQNLVTEDERTIIPPGRRDQQFPEWIRVGPEYFKAPPNRAKPPGRGTQEGSGRFRLVGDEIPDFIDEDLPDIRRESRLLARPNVARLRVVSAAPELRTRVDLDQATGQVLVRPRYRTGTADLSHADVSREDRHRRYVRKESTFHRIDWRLVDSVNKAIQDAELTEHADGSYGAPTLHFEEIINVFSRLGILAEGEVFGRFRERLLGFAKIESAERPSTLKPDVEVREYQQAGYDWLAFLKDYGLPGTLADEMGLGKTLQALLAVAHFRDQYGPCPSVVVCPAALVEKWIDETYKFFRGLRAISHAGGRRREQLRENIGTADLVVTSYETLVRDADFLARWRWRFLIADEAQRIKNPGTQRARAIRTVPAEARIAITGTPVENRLLDLWSIFDFLASGYLGTQSDFERRFADPIERRGDRAARDLLVRRTGPFVLRRLKRQVASELPDKIMKPLRCELTPVQRELYRAVVQRDLEAAIGALGGRKLSLGNPHIFAVLTKLKQICCHPGLVTNDFSPYKAGVSGKFDTFMEVVEQIMDAEVSYDTPNKLVGFSQYVSMAGYLCDYLRSRGKQVGLIDGNVPPRLRPSICEAFNRDLAQFGMILTLGSGGLGLDLQGANHVVLYDRWWNPAVEDQAIDRVHRLGQQREVVVVTLTTRGTLEERIEGVLGKKRGLSEQVIQAEELMRKEVTREELLELVRLSD